MNYTAFTTFPGSYTELVQTLRTRQGLAAAANSGGVPLIDDRYTPAGRLALIQQLGLQHAPAGVQYGLGHPGLSQFPSAHIADVDELILIDDSAAELMQGMRTAAGGPAVQALGLTAIGQK